MIQNPARKAVVYCQPWHTYQRGGRALLVVNKPHNQNVEQGEREMFHSVLWVDGWATLDTSVTQDREKQLS